MVELWASYQSALAAGARRAASREQSVIHYYTTYTYYTFKNTIVNLNFILQSPVLLGSTTAEPGGTHDETSSSAGNGKDDDDALASDDESDERLDPQQHDPERLKAFNVSSYKLGSYP